MPAQLLSSAHVNVPKSGSLVIKQSDTAAPVHKPMVLLMLGSYGDLREPRQEANLDEPVIWMNGALHVSSTVEVNGWPHTDQSRARDMTKWPALDETQKSDGIGCSLTVWLWSMSSIISSRRGSSME